MRRVTLAVAQILAFALILSLAMAGPAQASGGSSLRGGTAPAVALFDVGPHSAAVTADSPQVHTGRNTFTLELCSLPPQAKATLKLTGPHGQVIDVPLTPLAMPQGSGPTTLPVGADGHAGHNHGGGSGVMGSNAGAAAGEFVPHSHDGGLTSDAGFSYHVRGSARLDEPGEWVGTVQAPDPDKGVVTNDFTILVVRGGPNPWYLWIAGLLIGGSLLLGAIGRRSPSKALRQVPSNVVRGPWIKRLMASPWFPAIFAYPTLVLFAYIVYTLLWGPGAGTFNLGTSLTWVFWWPLIPLFMFLLGRFWCAICPFATVIDLVQKVAGLGRPVPPFLKKYGIWLIDATFLLITWADHVFGVVENPRGSGYLLAAIVVALVVTGVYFERRAWCRYLCFLGGLNGNYSRASALQLRATPAICAECSSQACYKGTEKAPGCPVFEFPRTMQTNANCNYCGHCVKNCPNDSLRLAWRLPTQELWFMARPKVEESFLAVVIVGIVLLQNISMLSFWAPLLQFFTRLLFGLPVLGFTAIFLLAMCLPMGVVLLSAALSSRAAGERLAANFARFGYAIIPLDLGGHIAHNLFHLLAESKTIYYNIAGLFGYHVTGPVNLLSGLTIQVLQYVILFLGIGGSLYTAFKIAARNGRSLHTLWPHLVTLLLFGAVNLYLFTLPMSHRV
ncbi:MAG: 4Fe-4S binding protein [Mycobacterium leprae]